ncbi:MAG: D-hexose-6-phosphate mutarotase, partial [Aeromonas sp.]
MQPIRPLTANCKLANNGAGLPVLTINNDFASAEISLFGAHVLSYQR